MKINTAFALGLVALTAVTSLSTITNVNYATTQYEAAVSGSMQPLTGTSASCKCPYNVIFMAGTGSRDTVGITENDLYKQWIQNSVDAGKINLTGFATYITLNNPGTNLFGVQNDITSNSITAIDAQIKAVVDQGNKVLIVGHSLGGVLATNLATKYGGCVDVMPIDSPTIAAGIPASYFERLFASIARNDVTQIIAAENGIITNPDYINWTNGNPTSLPDQYHTPFGKTDAASIRTLDALAKSIDDKIKSCKPGPTDYCPNINEAQFPPLKDTLGNTVYKDNLKNAKEKCYWKSTQTASCFDRQTSGGVPVTRTGTSTSYISQADADAKAKAIANNYLSKATGGRCGKAIVYYNETVTVKCPAPYTGEKTIESPVATQRNSTWPYQSTVSQADATGKASSSALATTTKDIADKTFAICKLSTACDTTTAVGLIPAVNERLQAAFDYNTIPVGTVVTATDLMNRLIGVGSSYIDQRVAIAGAARTVFTTATFNSKDKLLNAAEVNPTATTFTVADVVKVLGVMKVTFGASGVGYNTSLNYNTIESYSGSGESSISPANSTADQQVAARIVDAKAKAESNFASTSAMAYGGMESSLGVGYWGCPAVGSLSASRVKLSWPRTEGFKVAGSAEFYAAAKIPQGDGNTVFNANGTGVLQDKWKSYGTASITVGATSVVSPWIGTIQKPAWSPTTPVCGSVAQRSGFSLESGYVAVGKWQFKCVP